VQENRIKKAIREGGVAVGTTLMEFGTRGIAKLFEYADLDWVMIDMEHSGYTIDRVADLVAWFKATPITVIVRPPENLYHYLSGIMDCGAMGVQVPHIESAEDARKVVDAVMYPPLGHRGVGLNAAHTDFLKPKASEYMPRRNAETTVVAMIESVAGIENIEEIAAVEGVDVIQASHNDLSVALGVPNQYDHPKYYEALRQIGDACKRHGTALKVNPHTDKDIEDYYKFGYRVLGVRHATVAFQDAIKGDADHLRAEIAKLEARR
jgi:2-keto-3-deoxy-L-rhamnonate aldolase RhmA